MFRYVIVLLLLGGPLFRAQAQQFKFLFADSTKDRHHGFLGYPVLSYAPETRWSAGASLIYYFRINRRDSLYRPSIIHPVFSVTQNKQVYFENPFQLFFNRERYYIYGIVAYYRYPYTFYGIGNGYPRDYKELYNSVFFNYDISALRKMRRHVYAGFKWKGGYYTISETEEGKSLSAGIIPGSSGGNTLGIGPMFLYDSRNNIFSSTRGSYVELSSAFNSALTGSDYTFTSFIADVRKFFPVHKHIFAAQGYLSTTEGNAPFYQLSLLGGPKRMRGYYEGRYRDKNYAMIQAEYRSPFIKHRIGFVAFAGTGLVFPNVQGIDFTYLQPSYGGGLRLKFNRKESLHVRMDAAFGNHTSGFYLILNEAF